MSTYSSQSLTLVLGPTNTGKTHLALERMTGYASGMIGFPLRLLARENYDRLVRKLGVGKVGLLTGEERILPAGARYLCCTVESMPLDANADAELANRRFDFVAVDETKPVVMEIPVRVVGNAPGVRAGGKLVKKLNRLRVRGLIQDLPDFIDVSIDTLEIGQSAKVSNVVVSGFELLDSPANAILSIKTTRALMQAAADAAKK